MEHLNQPEFQLKLANLLRARFPYLYVATWEEDRALSVIRSVAADARRIKTTRRVHVWSVTRGMTEDDQPGKDNTKAPLKALEMIEACDYPAIFVLQDFHVYLGGSGRVPDFTVIRKIRDLLIHIKHAAHPINVIFISPVLVLPDELQKAMTIVDFELPSFIEIQELLDAMIEANAHSGRLVVDLQPADKERVAKAALGLTLHEAENAFARAMVEDGKMCRKDVEIILEEKRQIIKKSKIVQFISSDLNMDDVGGLDNLKRWLSKRENAWLESARTYGLPSPKGVLITGVPGCGKSLIAKAVSAMWQLPLLRLDVGSIFSGIVGSSEENMRRAIQIAEAISPSVLWIDEIEKGFSGTASNADSGTSSRIFATFLTWMQEKEKPVFVVATANNIAALPPEMLRKGRFDEIFFVDLPTRMERMQIFHLHLSKRLNNPALLGSLALNDDTCGKLADLTEGFVGAEIEQIVISALFEAFSEHRTLRWEDFVKSIQQTVPLSVTQAEQIHAIREWANLRAVAATQSEARRSYIQSSPTVPDEQSGNNPISMSRGGRSVDF